MTASQPSNVSPAAARIMQALSPEAFRALGAEHIAYIKPVLVNERAAWSVYAADGTALSVHLSEQAATASARQQSMVSVHTH